MELTNHIIHSLQHNTVISLHQSIQLLIMATLSPTPLKVSTTALNHADKVKSYLDNHMKNKFGHVDERNESRRELLERTMAEMKLSDDVRSKLQAKLNETAGKPQAKLGVNDFEKLTIIGRGMLIEIQSSNIISYHTSISCYQ